VDGAPGPAPQHEVVLVPLRAPALEALLRGDLAAASAEAGAPLTVYFLDERWLWQLRLDQAATDPGALEWTARAAVDAMTGAVVGHVGFHGPPDEHGTVEVAYAVDPAWRRRGYAGAMLGAALRWATAAPGVTVVRASVSPGNAASLATLRPFGFAHVGEQVDEVDGLELVFERPVRSGATPARASGG
jgi:ribosomal-protein-alanine N-acetyltransferase